MEFAKKINKRFGANVAKETEIQLILNVNSLFLIEEIVHVANKYLEKLKLI